MGTDISGKIIKKFPCMTMDRGLGFFENLINSNKDLVIPLLEEYIKDFENLNHQSYSLGMDTKHLLMFDGTCTDEELFKEDVLFNAYQEKYLYNNRSIITRRINGIKFEGFVKSMKDVYRHYKGTLEYVKDMFKCLYKGNDIKLVYSTECLTFLYQTNFINKPFKDYLSDLYERGNADIEEIDGYYNESGSRCEGTLKENHVNYIREFYTKMPKKFKGLTYNLYLNAGEGDTFMTEEEFEEYRSKHKDSIPMDLYVDNFTEMLYYIGFSNYDTNKRAFFGLDYRPNVLDRESIKILVRILHDDLNRSYSEDNYFKYSQEIGTKSINRVGSSYFELWKEFLIYLRDNMDWDSYFYVIEVW